jgi:hypothetical protein
MRKFEFVEEGEEFLAVLSCDHSGCYQQWIVFGSDGWMCDYPLDNNRHNWINLMQAKHLGIEA